MLGSTSTVKPVFSGHSKIDKTKILMTNGSLMKVESIAECSKGSILQYFGPAVNDKDSLQRGSNGFIKEKTILFQGSRGGPTFPRGGSNFFQGGGGVGGVQMLISIETHITCGSGPLISPLDPHMITL